MYHVSVKQIRARQQSRMSFFVCIDIHHCSSMTDVKQSMFVSLSVCLYACLPVTPDVSVHNNVQSSVRQNCGKYDRPPRTNVTNRAINRKSNQQVQRLLQTGNWILCFSKMLTAFVSTNAAYSAADAITFGKRVRLNRRESHNKYFQNNR